MSAADLLPAENMALTVAIAQIKRGETPTPNISVCLIAALARIARGEEFEQ